MYRVLIYQHPLDYQMLTLVSPVLIYYYIEAYPEYDQLVFAD